MFGMGLFGSVYLMPVFLAYVRGHNALEIGEIMLVTGVAQLIVAPLATLAVRRIDVRLLTGFGFLLFAIGLGMSAEQTQTTDFAGMFWPQVLRGTAIMFCILPPTQLALGQLAKSAVADASALFNLMRNLGGAIGIAVIDTVIYTRAPEHAHSIAARLASGDTKTAALLGIPLDIFSSARLDPQMQALAEPLVQKVAYVDAVNDAWLLIALVTFVALGALVLAKRAPPAA